MIDVPRIEPRRARELVRSGEALLVCAYEDEQKCRSMALDGAITRNELERRKERLPRDQTLVFYCA